MVLLVALAVLGVTILQIGQLIPVHLFVGMLLLGPVALKLTSTGYRFVRYYTRSVVYREKGPPQALLRAVAPVVVATVVVFVSGLVLLFAGPQDRGPWVSIHKVSFIVWRGSRPCMCSGIFDGCRSSGDPRGTSRGACRAHRPAAWEGRSRSPGRWPPGWC